MSLYQVSTRASRRRRIGAWIRERWSRRIASGRHHQTGGVSSRYAYAPKVVQKALVPWTDPIPTDLPPEDVEALVRSQGTVKLSVPTVKQRPGRPHAPGGDRPAATSDSDPSAEPPAPARSPKVPQQRPPGRTPPVFPNAYRAR
jgi:hypothetical protein